MRIRLSIEIQTMAVNSITVFSKVLSIFGGKNGKTEVAHVVKNNESFRVALVSKLNLNTISKKHQTLEKAREKAPLLLYVYMAVYR